MAAGMVWPLALVFLCLVPFAVALVVSLVTSYVLLRRSPAQIGGASSALDILKARYAQGEITHEQYEEMRQALEQ